MTIKELYDATQGDYSDAIARLRDENRIRRFLGMFAADPSVSQLREAVQAQNWENAFRAVHTLKGVTSNLSLSGLYNLAVELTEKLRPLQPMDEAGAEIYNKLCSLYDSIIAGLQNLE